MARCERPIKHIVCGRPEGVRERLRHLFGRPSAWESEAEKEHPAAYPSEEPARGGAAPEGYLYALEQSDLANGQLVEVHVGGQAICVAMVRGTVYALDNKCPHADGPLADGELEGTSLRCPFHGWEFDVRTGDCGVGEEFQLTRHPVKSLNGSIYISLN